MVNVVDNGGTGQLEKAPSVKITTDSAEGIPEGVVSVLSPRSDLRAAKLAEEEANKAKSAAEMEVRASCNIFFHREEFLRLDFIQL